MFRFHAKIFFMKTHMVDDEAFMELEAIFLGHFLFFFGMTSSLLFMVNLRDAPHLWELNRFSPNYYTVNTCHDYHHMLVFVCSDWLFVCVILFFFFVLTFFNASVIWGLGELIGVRGLCLS